MASREQMGQLWKGPAITWLTLLALFALSTASAYLPMGRLNVTVNLIIAVVMIVLLMTFLMDLRRANVLVHILAVAGVFWSLFLFTLTFTDYLTRHY